MKGVSILVYICLLLAAVLWHLVNFSGFFHISQLPSLIWLFWQMFVCRLCRELSFDQEGPRQKKRQRLLLLFNSMPRQLFCLGRRKRRPLLFLLSLSFFYGQKDSRVEFRAVRCKKYAECVHNCRLQMQLSFGALTVLEKCSPF